MPNSPLHSSKVRLWSLPNDDPKTQDYWHRRCAPNYGCPSKAPRRTEIRPKLSKQIRMRKCAFKQRHFEGGREEGDERPGRGRKSKLEAGMGNDRVLWITPLALWRKLTLVRVLGLPAQSSAS